MDNWDLENPKEAEAALAYFYSLPDNEILSEQDEDFDAIGELQELQELLESDNSFQDEITAGREETDSMEVVEPEPSTSFDKPISRNSKNPKRIADVPTSKKAERAAADAIKYDAHIEWSHDTTILDNLNLDLSKKANCNIDLGNRSREIDYFFKVFEGVTELLVNETNRYAIQNLTRKKNSDPSPSKNWTDTNSEEIKALIGMLILMGIHRLPRLSNYWSSDPLLGVPQIAQIMSSKRYKKLIENLHVNNNETAIPKGQPGYDKLHKLRPLLQIIGQNSCHIYKPSSTFSVDESMIPFKGRSGIKQYMPKKPIKWGYKVWCLADATTGYMYNFDVYTGKSDTPEEEGMTGEKVVRNLASVIRNTSCLIAFDNFFTTYPLMKNLMADKIYAIGTVRSNRKGLPDMMKNKKPQLKRGEFMFRTKESVAAVKWMDNNPVCFLSNYCSPKNTNTVFRKTHDGSKIKVSCPEVVSKYNEIMGGVDRFDQLRECYEIGRRSTKWWHRLFYYFLDMAIINAYILMKIDRQTPKAEQLAFRINLARQLIGNFSSRKKRSKSVPFMANKGKVPDEVRLTAVGDHLPNKTSNYRRCRLCSAGHLEKRTRIVCTKCAVPLCLDPCFKKFHGK